MSISSTKNAGPANLVHASPAKPERVRVEGSLSDQQIREIRALREFKKYSYKALAARYNVNYSRIRNILTCTTGAFVIHTIKDLPL